MGELDQVVAQGYYNKVTTSAEVAKSYHAFCRRHDRPCIWLDGRHSGFRLLMSVDASMKPKRATTAQVAALCSQWELRLGYKPQTLDLDAKEASVVRLTEDQAKQLAGELWAIVGRPGAYEHVETEDEDQEED